MRLPTMIFGLAALLAVPALLLAQDAGDAGASKGAEAAKDASAASKDAKASEASKDSTARRETGPRRPSSRRASPRPKPSRHRPRCCSALSGRRRRSPPAPSASTPRAALPAPRRCPSTGRPGRHMRLSRNRNWGHPELITLRREARRRGQGARRLAGPAGGRHLPAARRADAHRPRQPPGGARRRRVAHAHAGPEPQPKEREELSATSMLADDRVSVNPKVWTEAHVRLLKRAASYPQVERVLVHPAIKKAVCDASAKERRPRLDEQDPAVLGPLLPLPHPHRLPQGQRRLPGPASGRPATTAAARS